MSEPTPKSNTEEFIKRSIEIHGDKYNYSLVVYKTAKLKVAIICNACGVTFYQNVNKHIIRKRGCPECKSTPTKTLQEFVEESNIRYQGFFDYSKTVYKNIQTPVVIICPKHGEFTQKPYRHLTGVIPCPDCLIEYNDNIIIDIDKYFNEFIIKAKSKHGDGYNYESVEYVNARTPVKILCKLGHMFSQTPEKHLAGNKCCPECLKQENGKFHDEFIAKAKNKHGGTYNYSEVEYINVNTPVKIRCPHGHTFFQKPEKHLAGTRCCPECFEEEKQNSAMLLQQQFVSKSNTLYNNKFDYSSFIVKSLYDKGEIKCSHCKVSFFQTRSYHLSGYGCPNCTPTFLVSEPKLLSRISSQFKEWIVVGQGSPVWLGKQRFDIYLPELNVAIEYQGVQHFVPVVKFGGEKKFLETLERDDRKRSTSEKNGCVLLYFTYDRRHLPDEYPLKIYTKEDELIDAIKKVLKFQAKKFWGKFLEK